MDGWAWGWVLFSFLSVRVELFVVCTSRTDPSSGHFQSRIDSSMHFFCPCVLMMLYLHCHCTFATTTHVWNLLKHRWPPFLWGHAWTHVEHVRPIEAATKHRVGGRIRFGGRGALHVRSWRLKSGYLPPSTLLIPLGVSVLSPGPIWTAPGPPLWAPALKVLLLLRMMFWCYDTTACTTAIVLPAILLHVILLLLHVNTVPS